MPNLVKNSFKKLTTEKMEKKYIEAMLKLTELNKELAEKLKLVTMERDCFKNMVKQGITMESIENSLKVLKKIDIEKCNNETKSYTMLYELDRAKREQAYKRKLGVD